MTQPEIYIFASTASLTIASLLYGIWTSDKIATLEASIRGISKPPIKKSAWNATLEDATTSSDLMKSFEKVATKYSSFEMNAREVQVFLLAHHDQLTEIERERIHAFLKIHKADITVPVVETAPDKEGSYR